VFENLDSGIHTIMYTLVFSYNPIGLRENSTEARKKQGDAQKKSLFHNSIFLISTL
jgi:hypothetical protein